MNERTQRHHEWGKQNQATKDASEALNNIRQRHAEIDARVKQYQSDWDNMSRWQKFKLWVQMKWEERG